MLGNKHLQKERISIYKYLVRLLIGKRKELLIIVDWSPLAEGSYYYLIRVSIPTKGRALTIYEECHRDTDHTNKKIHKAFLKKLQFILPENCQPIIITDAGFRNSWFQMVETLNWNWLGRIRNNTLYHAKTTDSWFPIKSLYLIATGKAKQTNTIKHRVVLSNIYLGWQVLFSALNLLSSKDIKITFKKFTHYYNVGNL